MKIDMKKIILICLITMMILSGCGVSNADNGTRETAGHATRPEITETETQTTKEENLGYVTDFEEAEYGDYILFGSDKNGNPMEWLVLRNYGEKILVISRYCVDNMAFGDNQFYSMSSVASFLKGFVNRFNEEEERRIAEHSLSEWEVGDKMTVKAFLLSQHEVNVLFEDGDAAEENGNIWWTCTNNEQFFGRVYAVDEQGGVDASAMCNEPSIGVRPAMYIYVEQPPAEEPKELKPIDETIMNKYEESIEMLMFSERGKKYIESIKGELAQYLSEELIDSVIETAPETDALEEKRFPVFTEALYNDGNALTKVYVPKVTDGVQMLVTFDEMVKSMPDDSSVRFALTSDGTYTEEAYEWYDMSLSKEEMLLYQRELCGYSSFTIYALYPDDWDRILYINDVTHTCRYRCYFDEDAKINKIEIYNDAHKLYDTYYFKLYELLKDEKEYYFGLGNINDNKAEELIIISDDGLIMYSGNSVPYEHNISLYGEKIREITNNGLWVYQKDVEVDNVAILESFWHYNKKMKEYNLNAIVVYDKDNMHSYIGFDNEEVTCEEYIKEKNEYLTEIRVTETIYGRYMKKLTKESLKKYAISHKISTSL